MRIIISDDLIENYSKGVQRGFGFLASKLRISRRERTLSALDNSFDVILFHASLHHFMEETPGTGKILANAKSDFVFAVYRKITQTPLK